MITDVSHLVEAIWIATIGAFIAEVLMLLIKQLVLLLELLVQRLMRRLRRQ